MLVRVGPVRVYAADSLSITVSGLDVRTVRHLIGQVLRGRVADMQVITGCGVRNFWAIER